MEEPQDHRNEAEQPAPPNPEGVAPIPPGPATDSASLDASSQTPDAAAERKAESEGADQSALMDARDREVRASRNLAESRNGFARALTDLSTLV